MKKRSWEYVALVGMRKTRAFTTTWSGRSEEVSIILWFGSLAAATLVRCSLYERLSTPLRASSTSRRFTRSTSLGQRPSFRWWLAQRLELIL